MSGRQTRRGRAGVQMNLWFGLGFVVIVVLFLVVAFYVSRLLFYRAVRQVVFLFRKRGATSPKSATTLEDLGLAGGGLRDRLFKPRDYRPYALRLLAQANIIRETEEGKVYVSEAELERSPVKKLARIK